MPAPPVPWRRAGATSAGRRLTEGVLVAAQPNGAATWFPCNDHPRSKATYRLAFECDTPYDVVATGALVAARARGSRTRRVFEQDVPMATYLASVHVGRYVRRALAPADVPIVVVLPATRERDVMHDLERLPAMTSLYETLFGPYPFDDYTVVVTADDLEIPLEAQAMATFGPNWLDGRRRHERLVAHEPRPPVVRQQPDPLDVVRHLAQRGLRVLRGVALGRARRRRPGPGQRRDPLVQALAPGPGRRDRRSRARPHVRRPRLQAGRPDPARPAGAGSAT